MRAKPSKVSLDSFIFYFVLINASKKISLEKRKIETQEQP